MKFKMRSVLSIILALLLILSLASCASGITPSASPKEPGDSAAPAEESANKTDDKTDDKTEEKTDDKKNDGSDAVYTNDGFKLTVPAEYDPLLIVETPQDTSNGVLFSVFEKASVEAGKAQGHDAEASDGWIFNIVRISEAQMRQLLCYDMSGSTVFAKGNDGNYYVSVHPTDVRFVREDGQYSEEEMEQWSELNEWAAKVRDTFVKDNSALTAEKHGNTDIDIYLSRIAYMNNEKYTVSGSEFGELEPTGVDVGSLIEGLLKNVTYEVVEDEEFPEGDYIAIDLKDEDVELDFFVDEGEENYIRMIRIERSGLETLYKATFEDGETEAGVVMQAVYDAIAARRDTETEAE